MERGDGLCADPRIGQGQAQVPGGLQLVGQAVDLAEHVERVQFGE